MLRVKYKLSTYIHKRINSPRDTMLNLSSSQYKNIATATFAILYACIIAFRPGMPNLMTLAFELFFGILSLGCSSALIYYLRNIKRSKKTILDCQFEINIWIKIVHTTRCLGLLVVGCLGDNKIDLMVMPWPLFNLIAPRTTGLLQTASFFVLSLCKLLLLIYPALFHSLSLQASTLATVFIIFVISASDFVRRYLGNGCIKIHFFKMCC